MLDRETKIVKLSILVLCFSLIFVYLIWFYVKGEQLHIINGEMASGGEYSHTITTNTINSSGSTTNIEPTNTKNNIKKTSIAVNSGSTVEKLNEKVDTTIKQENRKINNLIHDTDSTLTIKEEQNNKNDEKKFIPQGLEERKILSGTKVIESTIDIAEVLGLNYKYALRDSKGIEYFYLGKGLNNDFVEIANQYDGTLHTIDTEYEIKKNKLFGDRVWYLNLPGYYKKIVLMIIKYDEDYWLITINYPVYHKSKNYLKHLFTD